MNMSYIASTFVFIFSLLALARPVPPSLAIMRITYLGTDVYLDLVGAGATFNAYWHCASLSFFIFAAVHEVLHFGHAD